MEGLAKPPKIVVVCGPTASGKTGLALQLCRQFEGEVVSADSMQVYKGLPVGTAALTSRQAAGVPYYLTAFLSPATRYSVANYVHDAGRTIGEIAARGRLPVICGGTGLYIQNLVEGTRFASVPALPGSRQKWQNLLETRGARYLLAQLAEVDPAHAEKLHEKDHKRIVRGLEQWEATGKTYSERAALSKPARPPYRALCICLTAANRQFLYNRIGQRVGTMLQNGLLKEAQWVYQNRAAFLTAAQAIGYKEFFPYFEGIKTLGQCEDALKQATRNYAKRQLTWFRRMENMQWLHIDREGYQTEAVRLVRNFVEE